MLTLFSGTKRYKNAPNNSFIGCVANDIRGQSNGADEYAAGFVLNSEKSVLSGCTATNVVHSNGQGYGIVLTKEQYGTHRLCRAYNSMLKAF